MKMVAPSETPPCRTFSPKTSFGSGTLRVAGQENVDCVRHGGRRGCSVVHNAVTGGGLVVSHAKFDLLDRVPIQGMLLVLPVPGG